MTLKEKMIDFILRLFLIRRKYIFFYYFSSGADRGTGSSNITITCFGFLIYDVIERIKEALEKTNDFNSVVIIGWKRLSAWGVKHENA